MHHSQKLNLGKGSVKSEKIEQGYVKRPSIAEFLPWKDYNDKHKVFLLEDNLTLATCFQLQPLACEARPEKMMQEIAQSLKDTLENAIPFEKKDPWILQFFTVRERNLNSIVESMQNEVPQSRKNHPLVQSHIKTMKNHIDFVSRAEGVFMDTQVTQQVFKGGYLNVYAVLYQKKKETAHLKNRYSVLEQIKRVSRKFSAQLRQCGIGVKRMKGEDFYHWMVKWFNPKPAQTNGDAEQFISELSLPSDEKKPFGWDFSEQLFFSSPESFEEGWVFDGMPHKVITVQNLSHEPAIGHLSAERKRGTDDRVFHLLDQMPEGSIFSMSIVFQESGEVKEHLKKVYDSALGSHPLALKTKTEVLNAETSIDHGNYLLPVTMAVYIKGNDFDELKENEGRVEVLLNSNGFKMITDDELYPIDAYLRYLPMCYDYHFDKKYNYRSRYILLTDITRIIPVYGRSRGTGNPGMVMFNRGGEPWTYDVFKDKTKNAHLLLLGETGTGKSNLLNYLAMQLLTLHNPRLFFIEAGGSFDLLADYCQSLGLSVNRVKINFKKPISLNPFAQGLRVLEQVEKIERQNSESRKESLEEIEQKLTRDLTQKEDNEDEEESRDVLGDMVLAALVMITGGEQKEEARITRSDRMLIMDAIIQAARTVRQKGHTQMIASDVVSAFEKIANTLDMQREQSKIARAREMADAMRYFVQDPVSSQFFNTYGDPWPSSDITVVDFGLFAQEGYEAQRSIAFAGVVGKMLAMAEANQFGDRSIVSIFDENHLFSKLPLLAAIQTRVAKMGRKLGLWLWVATQNLKDFADESRKTLSLLETWVCLALPQDELDQIKRFKILTPEQEALFLSARKEPKKYTEGVLLSPKIQGLFRNVPPRLYLAMAATEQAEKFERRQLMKKQGGTEIDAVHHIASEMMKKTHEEVFDE